VRCSFCAEIVIEEGESGMGADGQSGGAFHKDIMIMIDSLP